MRRADRLFRIVDAMRGGRRITAAQLAALMEVSERTIYRDIADLQASGVPVEGEAGYGYVMAEGYHLPPLMFTEAEITALVAGARLIRAWGGAEMAAGAEDALRKISAVLPETARARAEAVAVHSVAPEMTPELAARLDRIERAVQAKERLEIGYADGAGAASTRIVRPLGLWFWGKVWTLVAWCELRDDFRVFRLDRIGALEPAGPFREEKDRTLAEFFRLGKHRRG
ncbi:YafY family protein [Mangrovicoccus sp. HB161399]|uniref:helix-turn-helix transcriptional regulator n=1 Tax=Mangrovicoccus sp. HB161399 TaxID=2720392 RepID=UPI00155218B2|nr:YafY family protein [Mangrovicoccus sp. HB161399]